MKTYTHHVDGKLYSPGFRLFVAVSNPPSDWQFVTYGSNLVGNVFALADQDTKHVCRIRDDDGNPHDYSGVMTLYFDIMLYDKGGVLLPDECLREVSIEEAADAMAARAKSAFITVEGSCPHTDEELYSIAYGKLSSYEAVAASGLRTHGWRGDAAATYVVMADLSKRLR